MIYNEKTVSSKTMFSGKIVKLNVDEVVMPGGKIKVVFLDDDVPAGTKIR